MYSNINVVRCVIFILEENISCSRKEDFKPFMIKILQKFSIVKTLVGVYEKRTGLSMGSSLSPILSNIFVGNLETKIVKKFIENKKIIFHLRFTDDSCLIIKKTAIRSFMRNE